MKSIELYTDKVKMIKLLVMAAVIFLIGIKPVLSDSTFVVVIGYLCFAIAAGCAITAGITLFSSKPTVILSANSGIFDRRILKKPISWNEIAKVEFVQNRNLLFLQVTATDRFELDRFRTLYRSTAAKTDGALKKFDINLSQITFNRKHIETLIRQKNK
ncbi:MAG: hypothetical protein EOO51_14005 [Flavobacterium sp.]|nr:MAG: hypothetical protein EOO51_14005 [Flavobacterium sp.]